MVANPFNRHASMSREFIYNASPTVSDFMASSSFGRLLVGPVGSGKTTGSIIELSRRMMEQQPAPLDGKRYTRFAIIRQTLKQMKDTVLKDFSQRYGSFMDWRVSESTAYFREGDLHSEYIFIPLDEPEDKKRLLSTNLTGAFINECIEIDIELLSDISGRCGRFPNEEFGVPTWKGIICDTNMPVEHTDWARFIRAMLDDEIPEWQAFKQPGGRDPLAENLAHLEQTPDTVILPEYDPRRTIQGRKYYERLVATGTPEYIRRYVDAEFGRDLSGSAVYNESFVRAFHVRSNIEPVDGRMLIIGQDFGRNPGCVITQYTNNGTLLVLDELATYDLGLYQHIEERLKPLLATPRYAGKRFIIVGDPAGNAFSTLFEMNEFRLLKTLGLPNIPGVTNDVDRRIRSVEQVLLSSRAGGPAFIVDGGRCPVLVEGLSGAYKYSKNKAGVSLPSPEKNTPYSHVQDALQYATMTATDPTAYQYAFAQTVVKKKTTRSRVSSLGWT